MGLGLGAKRAPVRSPLVGCVVVGRRLALQRKHPKVPGEGGGVGARGWQEGDRRAAGWGGGGAAAGGAR